MKFRLKDGERASVEFDGVLLASSSSDDGKTWRWTELHLYRVTGDGPITRYVLHKIGRSVVYHRADSRCTRQAKAAKVGELLRADDQAVEEAVAADPTVPPDGPERVQAYLTKMAERVPCSYCNPADIYDPDTSDDSTVLVEQDRFTVVVTDSERGVVENLHGKDEHGTLFLTKTARTLLERAVVDNPALREAWEVRVL